MTGQRERDADFVQQCRELSDYYASLKPTARDVRVYMTYWLAKGHKYVAERHWEILGKKVVAWW